MQEVHQDISLGFFLLCKEADKCCSRSVRCDLTQDGYYISQTQGNQIGNVSDVTSTPKLALDWHTDHLGHYLNARL